MLRRVLESCENISPDARSNIRFIIVENGSAETAQDIVSDFKAGLAIEYTHEPRVGIVYARNAAVDAFLKTDAKWMATIDDDETVDAGWLTAMLDAIETYPRGKTFAGPHHRITPQGANRWLASKPMQNPKTGTPHWNASTANALFSREVFELDAMNLRFHPMFNLSGGSDTFLFFQLKDLGEDVLWVREAECFEPTVIERTRLRFRIKRTIQGSQNWSKTTILRFGKLKGGISVLLDGLNYAVNFITFGLVGGILYLFNRNAGFNVLNRSLAFGCMAIGYFKALTVKQGMLYDKVDGE
jgi:succinoglycan biosynthesis protein ExoM